MGAGQSYYDPHPPHAIVMYVQEPHSVVSSGPVQFAMNNQDALPADVTDRLSPHDTWSTFLREVDDLALSVKDPRALYFGSQTLCMVLTLMAFVFRIGLVPVILGFSIVGGLRWYIVQDAKKIDGACFEIANRHAPAFRAAGYELSYVARNVEYCKPHRSVTCRYLMLLPFEGSVSHPTDPFSRPLSPPVMGYVQHSFAIGYPATGSDAERGGEPMEGSMPVPIGTPLTSPGGGPIDIPVGVPMIDSIPLPGQSPQGAPGRNTWAETTPETSPEPRITSEPRIESRITLEPRITPEPSPNARSGARTDIRSDVDNLPTYAGYYDLRRHVGWF